MKIIICLDDHMGYAFNNRKQSADRYLERHIESKIIAGGEILSLDMDEASEADWIWIQTGDFPENVDDIEELMVYRWNRSYPYDKAMPSDFLDNYILLEKEDFPGSSHDVITFEHYVRCAGEGDAHEE